MVKSSKLLYSDKELENNAQAYFFYRIQAEALDYIFKRLDLEVKKLPNDDTRHNIGIFLIKAKDQLFDEINTKFNKYMKKVNR